MGDIIISMSTDFLYARPSFTEGLARILDFSGTLNEYNNSPSGEIADEIALKMDWVAVGKYLHGALIEYEQEIKKAFATGNK